MARETGVYRRGDSRRWGIATTLPNGRRLRITTGTEDRKRSVSVSRQDQSRRVLRSEFRDQAKAHVAGSRSPVPLSQAVPSALSLVQANLQSARRIPG